MHFKSSFKARNLKKVTWLCITRYVHFEIFLFIRSLFWKLPMFLNKQFEALISSNQWGKFFLELVCKWCSFINSESLVNIRCFSWYFCVSLKDQIARSQFIDLQVVSFMKQPFCGQNSFLIFQSFYGTQRTSFSYNTKQIFAW